MPYICGEKPGSGKYECTRDGFVIELDDDTDTLPPCPKCSNCIYNAY
jgi:hypothetical protein